MDLLNTVARNSLSLSVSVSVSVSELSDPNEMVNFWEVSVRSVLDNHAPN